HAALPISLPSCTGNGHRQAAGHPGGGGMAPASAVPGRTGGMPVLGFARAGAFSAPAGQLAASAASFFRPRAKYSTRPVTAAMMAMPAHFSLALRAKMNATRLPADRAVMLLAPSGKLKPVSMADWVMIGAK